MEERTGESPSGAWACVCGHRACRHNGPLYATGLGTKARGCDDCGCAYYCPERR